LLGAVYDKAEHNCSNCGLGAVGHIQLGQDTGHLVLDRPNRKADLHCDLTVGAAGRQTTQDVTLAIVQVFQLRCWGGAFE